MARKDKWTDGQAETRRRAGEARIAAERPDDDLALRVKELARAARRRARFEVAARLAEIRRASQLRPGPLTAPRWLGWRPPRAARSPQVVTAASAPAPDRAGPEAPE